MTVDPSSPQPSRQQRLLWLTVVLLVVKLLPHRQYKERFETFLSASSMSSSLLLVCFCSSFTVTLAGLAYVLQLLFFNVGLNPG